MENTLAGKHPVGTERTKKFISNYSVQGFRKTVRVCDSMDLCACGFKTRDFVPQTVSPQRRISSHGIYTNAPNVLLNFCTLFI